MSQSTDRYKGSVARQAEMFLLSDPAYAETVRSRLDRASILLPNGCRRLQRGLMRDGYGRIRIMGFTSKVLAHRAAYLLSVGPIPAGLEVDHLCHNADRTCPGGFDCLHRSCVAPGCLEAVPRGVNIRRRRSYWASRDGCSSGHVYTAETIYWWRGNRHCRVCRAREDRARRARRKLAS